MAKERVLLVDGSSLLFRAWFALPGTLMTSAGLHTNAIFGFASMFRKLAAGRKAAYGAVIFDPPGPVFRHERYAEYKSDRPPMPGELKEQLPWIDRVVQAHAFPLLRVPGYEADDVIGTLTKQALARGHEVHIIAGDKDFAQLIGEDVRMVDTLRDVTYDAELVYKKWGAPPHRFIDFLALMGDKVDSIPGVPGIGGKGAAALLEQYGDLEGVLAHAHEVKGKKGASLKEHAELARLSRELATIDTDVPLPLDFEDLRLHEPDRRPLARLYLDLEFYSLISPEDRAALDGGDEETDYRAVTSLAEAREVLAELFALPGDARVAVEPVFDGDPYPVRPLVGLAVSWRPGQGRYFAFDAPGPSLGRLGVRILGAWLGDRGRLKVGHDLKALQVGLLGRGSLLAGAVFDTRLASFLIDPTRLIPHRLDQVVREFLQRTVPDPKDVVGAGKAQVGFSEAEAEAVAGWACRRADLVQRMWAAVAERVEEEGQTEQLVERDLPLSWVLADMEAAGIRVDREELEALGAEFRDRVAVHRRRIFEIAGHEFNLRSTKQLGDVLFGELGLPVLKKTKTGWSTDADVLERLADQGHEIAVELLEQRKFRKLIDTYTDVLAAAVRPETGRIHATFQQTVGATGRLITTDPDLQRTPISTPEGKRIRRAFVASPGCRIVSADWSQIELRLLAHFSEDPLLLEAYREGADVHARTASRLFDVPVGAVTHPQRQVGKTVNFATIYGQGATALAQQLKVKRTDAAGYIDRFFAAYAGVRAWLDRTIEEGVERGWVQTLSGRRRTIPELRSNNPTDLATGKRIAANTPIQGSAAGICKLVMLEIPRRLAERGLEARMVLQIHDELLFEAPEDEVEAVAELVRHAMETVVPLRVPLVAEVGVGASWAEAH